MRPTLSKLFAVVLCIIACASTAQASFIPASWSDSATVGSGVLIEPSNSYTYQHDLRDNGFDPGSDLITNFYLTIDLVDDELRDSREAAFINLPGFFGDAWVTNFGLAGAEYGGWSIFGLFELNILGTLTVTISSVSGDFTLVGSQLTAGGYASVPEPGALGLLGIGLLGIAVAMRRRRPT